MSQGSDHYSIQGVRQPVISTRHICLMGTRETKYHEDEAHCFSGNESICGEICADSYE